MLLAYIFTIAILFLVLLTIAVDDSHEGFSDRHKDRNEFLKPSEPKPAKKISFHELQTDIVNPTPYYVILDCETDGLPLKRNAPMSDVKNWPFIVSLSWLLVDKSFHLIEEHSYIIKPRRTIPAKARSIHGITTKYAREHGQDIPDVLDIFQNSIMRAKYLVCHNIDFDRSILYAEHLRIKKFPKFRSLKSICTMKSTTEFVGAYNGYGLKWPKLEELLEACYPSTEYSLQSKWSAHDSLSDARVTLLCFEYLFIYHKELLRL